MRTPHFLVKKTSDFSQYMWCARTDKVCFGGGKVSIFAILYERLLYSAPKSGSYKIFNSE